jgi:hypothetical protein
MQVPFHVALTHLKTRGFGPRTTLILKFCDLIGELNKFCHIKPGEGFDFGFMLKLNQD